MRLHNRLRRLEQKLPDPGCPGCRHRDRVVVVDCQRQRDSSVTSLEPVPSPCTTCGRVPEFIVEIVRPYEEGRTLDNERLVPRPWNEGAT
jgi:hypothetical protein